MAQARSTGSETTAAAPAIANPAPLGLSAFALTTFVLSAANASLFSAPNIVVGLAFFYGGIVQLVAGIQEFRAGNTFGATAFCSYAGFWLAFAVIFTPTFNIIPAYVVGKDFGTALGYFLLGWTIFTGILFLCALRTNIATLAVFGLLFLTFLALTIGAFGASTNWDKIGGWLGIVTAIVAWYTAMAGIVNSTKAAFKLPVGPMA
jgi:succinate-acetate transporter protein